MALKRVWEEIVLILLVEHQEESIQHVKSVAEAISTNCFLRRAVWIGPKDKVTIEEWANNTNVESVFLK